MRVVLDTNVFVSGIFWAGPPSDVLIAWRDRKVDIVLSLPILEEYLRIAIELSRKFPMVDLFPFIDLLTTRGKICIPKRLPRQVCHDSSDDQFLACALGGNVRCIVSGDHHLLDVSGYKGIEILKPREFVNRYL